MVMYAVDYVKLNNKVLYYFANKYVIFLLLIEND